MAFTFFFRDSQTLEVAIERLVHQVQGQRHIDIWDAGCAHGPEPFTAAILLRERMSHFLFRNVRIQATDLDLTFAPHVVSGIYPDGEVQRIPTELRQKYFQPADQAGHVQVIPEIRDRVRFRQHDLLSLKAAGENFDLVICKNVLLHFGEEDRVRVLGMFHKALRPNGIIAMEHTQKLPECLTTHFQCLNSYAQIYQKLAKVTEVHPAHRQMPLETGLHPFGLGSEKTVKDSATI